MRTFYLLAVICIAGAYANPLEYSPNVVSCAEESNVSLETLGTYVEKLEAGAIKPSKEFYCFNACLNKKERGSALTYDMVMNMIKIVDEKTDFFENKPFTRQELESLALNCKREGLRDCDYLQCIKLYEYPFLNMILLR